MVSVAESFLRLTLSSALNWSQKGNPLPPLPPAVSGKAAMPRAINHPGSCASTGILEESRDGGDTPSTLFLTQSREPQVLLLSPSPALQCCLSGLRPQPLDFVTICEWFLFKEGGVRTDGRKEGLSTGPGAWRGPSWDLLLWSLWKTELLLRQSLQRGPSQAAPHLHPGVTGPFRVPHT